MQVRKLNIPERADPLLLTVSKRGLVPLGSVIKECLTVILISEFSFQKLTN